MNDNQSFQCAGCGHYFEISLLSKRVTDKDNYCPECSKIETCAACGEFSNNGEYKLDVGNWVCDDCKGEYKDVAEYIKPLNPILNS